MQLANHFFNTLLNKLCHICRNADFAYNTTKSFNLPRPSKSMYQRFVNRLEVGQYPHCRYRYVWSKISTISISFTAAFFGLLIYFIIAISEWRQYYSDFDEILYTAANFELDERQVIKWKNCIGQSPSSTERISCSVIYFSLSLISLLINLLATSSFTELFMDKLWPQPLTFIFYSPGWIC